MRTNDIAPVLAGLFSELVDGASKTGAFILNSGDAGLLRSLDKLSAADASRSANDGATIAAHAQHLRYGLSLMNRWAAEGGNPFADAKWDEAWKTSAVDDAAWAEIRSGLRDETRRWLLLQNAAFLPLFREAMRGRDDVGNERIDQLEPLAVGDKAPLAEIFADVGRDSGEAARKTLAFLRGPEQAVELIDAARTLIFLKGTNSHDYKYSSAVLEDYHQLTPAWRDRFLAASLYKMRHEGERTTPLIERIQSALS